MRAHQAEFKVSRMALMLKVSRDGFYHWLKFGELKSPRALKQPLRDEQIQLFVLIQSSVMLLLVSKLNWKIISKLYV